MGISFRPINPDGDRVGRYTLATGQVVVVGDMLAKDGSGEAVIATAATSADFIGPLAGTPAPGSLNYDANIVNVFDSPFAQYEATLDVAYSTALKGTQADLAGTTGAQTVDSTAPAVNVFTIVDGGTDFDPTNANTGLGGHDDFPFVRPNYVIVEIAEGMHFAHSA